MPLPEKPRLRHIEMHPFESKDGMLVTINDPLGFAEGPMVLTLGAGLVMEQLNGERTLRDVQAELLRIIGQALPMEQIEKLVGTLEKARYLDSPSFHEHVKQVRDDFFARSTRESILAGVSFPEDPAELRAFLDSLFISGPGMPDPTIHANGLRAIVAPHIDLKRGRDSFARAYKALVENTDADVFVILGIAHFGDDHPFILTDKGFETPLGTVPAETSMVARLRELAPPNALGDEFLHRNEHSIEFQALMLRYLYPDRGISIVPILCGSMHEQLETNTPPAQTPDAAGFLDALHAVIDESPKKVCIIAGVDFSHVGQRFGAEEPVDETILRALDTFDHTLIDSVSRGDSDELFRRIQIDQNANGVCGYPALYSLLELLHRSGKDVQGSLLSYEQSPEEETGSVVTFASMIFPPQITS